MVIHVYHPYRQPDGENHCQAVNGHCSHLCLPAPQINARSPKISCACPNGLRLMDDNLMCVEDGKVSIRSKRFLVHATPLPLYCLYILFVSFLCVHDCIRKKKRGWIEGLDGV